MSPPVEIRAFTPTSAFCCYPDNDHFYVDHVNVLHLCFEVNQYGPGADPEIEEEGAVE